MGDPRRGVGGFTLVEIAIVLVIIGLLLGGILKGQEMINNAKVRAIADRQNSLKSAWFSFVDRFAALPGDYIQAQVYITGATSGNGDGHLEWLESPLAFQHLASAGYLRCPHCTETATDIGARASNSLINIYGGIISIWADGIFYFERGQTSNAGNERLMIHTGPRVPSNILAEVDRKIDDGTPNTGDFRANVFDPADLTGADPYHSSAWKIENAFNCVTPDSEGKYPGQIYNHDEVQYWRPANASPPVWPDCGGSVFI